MPTAKIPYTEDELFEMNGQRTFTAESLKEIAFPIGGIGTGTVSLGGRGQLRDWEIFNRPAKGKGLMYTFPAIYARTESGDTIVRVLESQLQPPFINAGGLPPHEVPGLPRLHSAIFTGEYPFAHVEFRDSHLPLKVELTAFSPMIPLNDMDSAIPCAVLRYKVTNNTNERVDTTICWNLQNACGNDGLMEPIRHHSNYGKQKNEFIDEGNWWGINLTQDKHPADDARFGSMAIATTHKEITCQEAWTRNKWWDDAQRWWDDFKTDGQLDDNGVHDRSDDITSDIASLGLMVSLAPGESAELPFIIAWYFPNRVNYWNKEEGLKDAHLHNRYGDIWKDAWDVAGYVVKNLPRLEEETRKFTDTLYNSTLPSVALDAAGSNMSIMRTQTAMWLDDDRFYAFEGCGDNNGCCPMNCTHVWNYEQAVAFLYPRLERTMRLTDFTHNVYENGKMGFRTYLPLGKHLWKWYGAADGQMGCILKYYREWLISGDMDFLKLIYPAAKQAMGFVWTEWDKDQDGVMEDIQHNTYDIEFKGPNTMMGTLYLGALKAMEQIAAILDDKEYASKCHDLYEKGSAKHVELLWNGEYFTQDVDLETAPRYQFGKGCLSDQLLGQWFSTLVDLGYVLPDEKVRTTLESIFKYNWKPDLSTHDSVQRVYALNDDAGLLLCTWPHGGRPDYPFTYADEVWTGIEYQVAAHLIYEGMLEEGLAIAKGVRDRHDGIARNPWDEFECGHHYARALASWSLITALSGFHYDAAQKYIAFGPRVNASDFRCFYSTGSGWGTFSQSLMGHTLVADIAVSYGELELQKIKLDIPSDNLCEDICVKHCGESIEAKLERLDDSVLVTLGEPLKIGVGESLEVAVG